MNTMFEFLHGLKHDHIYIYIYIYIYIIATLSYVEVEHVMQIETSKITQPLIVWDFLFFGK
jgi:hypothetical protein